MAEIGALLLGLTASMGEAKFDLSRRLYGGLATSAVLSRMDIDR